jgi:hypothetical protein
VPSVCQRLFLVLVSRKKVLHFLVHHHLRYPPFSRSERVKQSLIGAALPQIISAPKFDGSLGKIVTLGTPFMDAMSPVLTRVKQVRTFLNIFSWIVFLTVGFWAFASRFFSDLGIHLLVWITAFVGLPVAFLFYRRGTRAPEIELASFNETVQTQPLILAIGSPVDEAWQILHTLRNIDNPMAVKTNLFSYLFSCLRSSISLSAEVDRIHGAKSYRDLGPVKKVVLFITHLIAVLIFFIAGASFLNIILNGFKDIHFNIFSLLGFILGTLGFFIAPFIFVLFLARMLGVTFYSAFLSPFRWVAQRAGSLLVLGSAFLTFFIRRRSWSVLLKIATGLEGYRLSVPLIEQCPSSIPKTLVKYEDMPHDAEQRAMDGRSAWLARHLGDVSQTFSKLAVNAADLTALLRTVEEDQTLVHGAYYTDDECIGRIADWIAGKG